MITLGKLERVDVRQVWTHEAHDFTPWLAQEENLQTLGETLHMDLILEAQEKNIGTFRADILAKDSSTGQWVLIENQLERTDHEHLGQIIAYASGVRANNVVWIAETVTSEHRSAIDWLNEMTNERLRFFAVEIEIWRIGDSLFAPKFNIASKPNDWTKTVENAVRAAHANGYREQIKQAMLQAMNNGGSLKYQDIADALGIALATVKKHGPSIKQELAGGSEP